MNQTTETLINVFNESELETLMTSLSGYMAMKRNQKRSTEIERVVFNKVVDALFVSRELNAIETSVSPIPNEMNVSEYKMMEALEYS